MTSARLLSTIFLLFLAAPVFAQEPFITTWQTDNPGDSDDDQITIPITGSGYDFTIDWGDSSQTTWQDGDAPEELTHTYDDPGAYPVEITGDFPRLFFNNEGDREKILSIEQWGDIEWSSMDRAFWGCTDLVINATDAPDLSSVESLSGMFWNAESMNSDLNHWDVSNVESLNLMFEGATSFNGAIGEWDVSNVTSLNATFAGASSFNQDISDWDVSNVTTLGVAFADATTFNQDIGGWDVSNVTSLNSTFNGASSFNQDIGDWDVSSVTVMNFFFTQASAFNQDISNWNVSSVTNMNLMFWGASAFDQNIGDWDVSNVTTMQEMFRGANAFNQNLGNWDVGEVTDMDLMLRNTGLSIENYDATLNGWAAQDVQSGVELGSDNLEFCAGANARQSLIEDHGWTITGDSAICAQPAPVAGWRMLSAPGSGLTVGDLAGMNLVQGIEGSYPNAEPNAYVGYLGPTSDDYAPFSSTGSELVVGSGFFWYLYDDTDFPGDPPPEFIDIENVVLPIGMGTAHEEDVTTLFGLPETEGNDLPALIIGNPFQEAFRLEGVSIVAGQLQTTFFAWDPESTSYVELTTDDLISPWQGVWAEIEDPAPFPQFTFAFDAVETDENPPIIGLRPTDVFAVELDLHGTLDSGREVADLSNRIRFEPDAAVAWDRHDGSKFYPPLSTDGYALLSPEGTRNGTPYRQAVRSLPSGLDEPVTIPLGFLSGEAGEFEVASTAENLPEGWSVMLRDLETGDEMDLLTSNYTFTGSGAEGWQNRFEVTVTPAGVIATENGPEGFRLSSPAPNPASVSTALVLRVDEGQTVTTHVYDALGRLVTTAHQGALEAGEETRLEIDIAALAAGAYIVRVEGEDFAETRRFAVVR